MIAFTDYLSGIPTAEQARRAVGLYRGEFLEGFFVNNAPEFEDWQFGQRERLRELALQGLALLVTYALTQENYQEGIGYAQQLLRLDPWREEAHRELMRLLALSGQRSAALEQFTRCQMILAEEFGVAPGQETVRLAEQIRADLLRPHPTPAPPLPIQQPAPFQPPPDLPYFVGRERLIKQIIAVATAPDSPNRLALIGMGGMGKTSLAIHLAHQLRDQFPDGVLWADVSQDDLIGLIDRWAEAYNCDFRTVADEASRAAALRDILKAKKALLILDDVDRVTKVRPLLPDNFPGKIIITTRSEEIAYHLKASPHLLQELELTAGLALLRQVVGEERVQAELAAANELCTLLQNLPLALNIAAQRLALRHQMHLRDMVARLQREKSRLTALDEQDQAVRASFLVSWRALDEKQKGTFALLGLFEGRSFTVDAVTAIAAADPYETEDHLFALNALCLVAQTSEGRYRQHPLLAEFAREHLADPLADQRLADYFLTFAQAHGQVYEALRPEWENVMAGMETAYKREMWTELLGYSEALTEAWFARGRYTEARRGYEWAVAAAQTTRASHKLATALLHWGRACLEQGDHEQARQLLQASRQYQQANNNLHGLAQSQVLLAHALLETVTGKDDFASAITLLESSQQLYQQLQHEAGEAEAIQGQARTYYFMADYQQAKALAQTALQKQQTCQDKRGELVTLRLLSQIFLSPTFYDQEQAAAYRWQALTLSETIQDEGELAVSLGMAAETHLAHKNFTGAWQLLERSYAILQRIGARRNLAFNLSRQSRVQAEMGHPEQALPLSLESLKICESLHDPILTASALLQVGDLLVQLNRVPEARDYWLHGIELMQPLHHTRYLEVFQHRLQKATQ